MVVRPSWFALGVITARLLLVPWFASPAWAFSGVGGDDSKGPSTTVTFQPVVWEPYIGELYVKSSSDSETQVESARLKMEKPEGELPGIRAAWKALKDRFGFDNLDAGRSEATREIVSGWTRSETGFLVHAASETKPSGDTKIVERLLAEAPAYFYSSVNIDFGKTLKADKEAFLLDKYFKALTLKITAHEIETHGGEYNPDDIRGPSSAQPFMTLFNYDLSPSRKWTELGGDVVTTGNIDKGLDPWRTGKFVEMRLALEVEGQLNDAEEPVRKEAKGAIRFIVSRPMAIHIDVLSRSRRGGYTRPKQPEKQ